MSSLTNCLKLHGIKKGSAEEALIRRYAREYRDEGYVAKEANDNAVKDILVALNKEKTSIEKQIREVMKPEPDLKPVEEKAAPIKVGIKEVETPKTLPMAKQPEPVTTEMETNFKTPPPPPKGVSQAEWKIILGEEYYPIKYNVQDFMYWQSQAIKLFKTKGKDPSGLLDAISRIPTVDEKTRYLKDKIIEYRDKGGFLQDNFIRQFKPRDPSEADLQTQKKDGVADKLKSFNDALGEKGAIGGDGETGVKKAVDGLLENIGAKLNPEVKNKIKNDLNWVNKYINTESYVAYKFPEYQKVWESEKKIYKDRDNYIADAVAREMPYYELNKKERAKVDRALELGRLQKKVWRPAELKLKFGMRQKGVSAYYAMRDKYGAALQSIKDVFVRLGVDEAKINEAFKELVGYVPFTRFGEWRVINRAEKSVEHYENKSEAYKRANELNRKYPKQIDLDGRLEPAIIVDRIVHAGKDGIFDGLDPASLSLFAHIADIDPNISNPFIDAARDYFKTLGFKSHFIEAKNTPGYSKDWQRVHVNYTVSLANYLSRIEGVAAMKEGLKDIDRERQPLLYEKALHQIDYLSHPRDEAAKLRSGLFLYYMALNPKSAVLNLTQTLTTTIPWLGQYSPWVSIKAGRAMKDIVANAFSKEEAEALRKAIDVTGEQMIYEYMGKARGDVLQNEKQKVAKALVYMFGTAETFNRRVAFLTAYRIGKELEAKGRLPKEFESVQDFAEKAVENTQFIYGKFNRPKIAQGKVGAVFFTFKQFTLQYFEMLAKMAKANDEDIRPGQFAKAMAIMLTLAGVTGLPFMKDIQKLLESITGENWDTMTRDAANDVFGNPQVGEILLHGITRLGPIDMSGSIGLGDVIPDMETISVLGPAGGVAQRVARSYPWFNRGEYLRGVETMAPEFAKNALAAYRIHNEGQRNLRGELIFSGEGRWPKTVNVGAKALSFQPSDMSRAYERERAQAMIGGKAADRKKEFVYRIAKASFENDNKEIQTIWNEIDKYNKDKDVADKIFIRPQELAAAVKLFLMPEDVSGLKHAPKKERSEYLRLKELFQ